MVLFQSIYAYVAILDHFNIISQYAHVNLKEISSMGRNCLHMAAQSGALSVLEELIDAYGLDVSSATANNMTGLHCAAKEGNHHTVSWLLDKGVDVDLR